MSADVVDLTPTIPAARLLDDLVEGRTEASLTKAVRDFRNGTLSPQQAYAVIAQISDLRLLGTDLIAYFHSSK